MRSHGPSRTRPRRRSRARSGSQTPGGVRATLVALRAGWSVDDETRAVRTHPHRMEQCVRRSRSSREPARQGSGRQGGDEPWRAGRAAHGRDTRVPDHGDRAPARAGRLRPARRGRALAFALRRCIRRGMAARRFSGARQRLRPALLQRGLPRSASLLGHRRRRTLSSHVDAPRACGPAWSSAGVPGANVRSPERHGSRAAGSLRHGLAVSQRTDGRRRVPWRSCGGGQGSERCRPRDACLRAPGRSGAVARSLPNRVRGAHRSGACGSEVLRRTPAQARAPARRDRSRRG